MTKYFFLTARGMFQGALLALTASCSGLSGGAGRLELPADQRVGEGVNLGGFEVLRRNASGRRDPGLNASIRLGVTGDASHPTLLISVDDAAFTSAVTLDVMYDARRLHPLGAEFHGLLGNDSQVLGASFLDKAGKVGLGQAALRGFRPAALHGRFATLRFEAGPMRGACIAGAPVSNPAGVGDVREGLGNFTAESDLSAQTASVQWTAQWNSGDGDQDGEIGIADITPIALHFGKLTTSDWTGLVADYDEDQEVGIADITPVALGFDSVTTGYRLAVSDNAATSPRTDLGSAGWEDFRAPLDQQNPAAGKLEDVFRFWKVSFDAGSIPSFSQLVALDTGPKDGLVRVYVKPVSDAAAGVEAYVDLRIGAAQALKQTLTVTEGDGTSSITLRGYDPQGDDIEVKASAPQGLSASPASATIQGGVGTLVFNFIPVDPMLGGGGQADFHGSDAQGGSSSASAAVAAAGLSLAPDTLYAIPLLTDVEEGAEVPIVMASGVTTNPFKQLPAARIVAPLGWSYVAGSFEPGSLGGGPETADGIWLGVDPSAFTPWADGDFAVKPYGGDSGQGFVDLALGSVGGAQVSGATGAICNFRAVFPPGSNKIGFVRSDSVDRTYYADGTGLKHQWTDVSNNDPNVPNTVLVHAYVNPGVGLTVIAGDGSGSITLGVADSEGDNVMVTAELPPACGTDTPSQILTGGNGELTFTFSADDLLAGVDGTVAFSAVDGAGETGQCGAHVLIAGGVPAFDYKPNTLYAIPLKKKALVGEEVSILVASGMMPNPFKNIDSVRITAPLGWAYVPNSFNFGAVGGLVDGIDGIWADLAPDFLLVYPDYMLSAKPYPPDPSLGYIDFNCTSVGGSDLIGGSGPLFNFRATFPAGVNKLGFIHSDTLDRTYYSDLSVTSYFWSDTSNSDPAVPNSLEVT